MTLASAIAVGALIALAVVGLLLLTVWRERGPGRSGERDNEDDAW